MKKFFHSVFSSLLISRVSKPALFGGAIAGLAIAGNAFAGFVTSSVGTGGVTSLTSAQPLNAIFPPGDNTAPTFATTITDLNTCLSNQQPCVPNQKTAALDTDNNGNLTNAEIMAAFSAMSCLTSVPSANYARAVINEIQGFSDLSDCSAIQTAINTAATYIITPPVITNPSSIAMAQYGSSSSQLTIQDGAGNLQSSNSFSVSHSISITDSDGAAITQNWFDIGTTGMLQLTAGTSIEDITPGSYTIGVTVTDTNSNSYGLSDSEQFTLTVSNQRGCIINNSIAASNFNTNGDNNTISGATVTISGSHHVNDLLFIRTATSSTSSNVVTYTNFGLSGVTATYNKTTGQMIFNGSASLSDWIGTFRKVGYIYDSSGNPASRNRSLIFSLSGSVVFNHSDGNSHFYQYKSASDIHFDTARIAADNTTLFGLQGYLATITSATEQAYIEPKLNGIGWIGGCDRLADTVVGGRCGITSTDLDNLQGKTQSQWTDTTGHWPHNNGESYFYWVTGPERLQFIGEDTLNCSSSNYAARQQETLPISGDSSLTDPAVSIATGGSNFPYHNFQGCEPNNWRHDVNGENYLHVYGDGAWNDFRHNDPNINGYLIEFGGMDGDPSVDLTENKSYDSGTEGQYCVHQN
ncbi:MAG: hypothetical protein ACON45_04210 [Paracoccaceae bacterium]